MELKLVGVDGPVQGNEYLLAVNEYLVGRDPSNDIVIADREVSRRHCKIIRRDTKCAIEDLNSTNGTFVNEVRLTKEYELEDGDRVRIGSATFLLVSGAPSGRSPVPRKPGSTSIASQKTMQIDVNDPRYAELLQKSGLDQQARDERLDGLSGQEVLISRRGLLQVAGMRTLKQQLVHEVIEPTRNPELFRQYRVPLPNGILFFGPPGCGKTYLAKALAEELGWSFHYCRSSNLVGSHTHETVTKIRAMFSDAIKNAPSVLFIDEFEAFVTARSELSEHQQNKTEEVNEFLANLEGCWEKRVLVIAATNDPNKIDAAVRRSGRLEKFILIPPPDVEARKAILELHLRNRPVDPPLDIDGVAGLLDGYSARGIQLLVDEAARIALNRRERIATKTLLAAAERVPASITPKDMQRYDGFARGASTGAS